MKQRLGGGIRSSFFSDESGQALLEYAMIITLLAIVVIASLQVIGSKVTRSIDRVNRQGFGNPRGCSRY